MATGDPGTVADGKWPERLPNYKSRPTDEFKARLKKYLGDLGWTQQDLAERTHLARSHLASWLSDVPDRPARSVDIKAVAWALGGGFAERDEKKTRGAFRQGAARSFDVAAELLLAAGYNLSDFAGDRNQVWEKITGDDGAQRVPPTLKVGWAEVPVLATRDQQGNPSGLAADITRAVAALCGFMPEWEYCEWGSLVSSVKERKYDLIAPILFIIAAREVDVAFSRSTRVLVKMKGLVHRSGYRDVFGSEPPQDKPITLDELDESKIEVNFAAGEAGQFVHSLLLPQAFPAPHAHPTVAAGIDDILVQPVSGQLLRCFLTDAISCDMATKRDSNLVSLSFQATNSFPLPIGFGVHPEEPRMLALINTALDVLSRNGYLDEYLRCRYSNSHFAFPPDTVTWEYELERRLTVQAFQVAHNTTSTPPTG